LGACTLRSAVLSSASTVAFAAGTREMNSSTTAALEGASSRASACQAVQAVGGSAVEGAAETLLLGDGGDDGMFISCAKAAWSTLSGRMRGGAPRLLEALACWRWRMESSRCALCATPGCMVATNAGGPRSNGSRLSNT